MCDLWGKKNFEALSANTAPLFDIWIERYYTEIWYILDTCEIDYILSSELYLSSMQCFIQKWASHAFGLDYKGRNIELWAVLIR